MAFQTENMRQAGVGAGPERRADEAYCHSCGNVISREAAICMSCGVAVRPALGSVTYSGGHAGYGEGKSKTTAIVFAIFFGIFTWLYTYREDAGKFWLAIGITIMNVILSVLTLGIWLFIAFPVGVGFWVWTLVDTTSKSDAWYAHY
jgi:hypothetical protein